MTIDCVDTSKYLCGRHVNNFYWWLICSLLPSSRLLGGCLWNECFGDRWAVFQCFLHISQHALLAFCSTDPLLLSLQDLVQVFGSAWASRWFRWAGTTLRPSASGRARDCLLRRSGSGLHVEGCKVYSLYTESVAYTLYVPRWRWSFAPVWWFVCI